MTNISQEEVQKLLDEGINCHIESSTIKDVGNLYRWLAIAPELARACFEKCEDATLILKKENQILLQKNRQLLEDVDFFHNRGCHLAVLLFEEKEKRHQYEKNPQTK